MEHPLWMEVSMGKSSMKGWFFMAKFDHQRVILLQNYALCVICKHYAGPIERIQDIPGPQNMTMDANATNMYIYIICIYTFVCVFACDYVYVYVETPKR